MTETDGKAVEDRGRFAAHMPEYIALLIKNEVEFDEQFLWK